MKSLKSKALPFVVLVVGFLFGATALSTFAFDPAPNPPPALCPPSIPGCNPPINSSATGQTKAGLLTLLADNGSGTALTYGLSVLNGIKIDDGSFDRTVLNSGAGKVLTSIGGGVGKWQAPTGGAASGGAVVFSPETTDTTAGKQTRNKSMIDENGAVIQANKQWPACFLTANKTGFIGDNGGSMQCFVNIKDGNWTLNTISTANDPMSCAARCMGYSSNPFQATCTTPKATVLRYESFTTTVVPQVAGTYLYKFGKQSTPSTSNTITWTHTTGGLDTETVTVYDSTGTNAMGTYTCINNETGTTPTVTVPRISVAIRNPSSTSSATCPGSYSAQAPNNQRILRGDYVGPFASEPGIWLNGSDAVIGAGSTYQLGQVAGSYDIKYKHRTSGTITSPLYTEGIISCTITITP